MIEIPLWQQWNPDNCNIFQINRIEFHIKLMLPTYSFSNRHDKGIHVCYICSFYSVNNTTSRNPAMFTIVWYPPRHSWIISSQDEKLCDDIKYVQHAEELFFHRSILIKIIVLYVYVPKGNSMSGEGRVPDKCKHGWVSWSRVVDRIKRTDIAYMDTFMWGNE
jgi:hypothetical protein